MNFLCKISVAILLLIFTTRYTACSQTRLSQKFSTINTRIDNAAILKVSIALMDVEGFKSRYKNQITILYYYRQTKTIIVEASYELIVNTFSNDVNIVFIDVLDKPVAEAGTDYFNIAFNKINRVRNDFGTLDGKGQKILIKEQRFDNTSIDLQNRSFETSIAALTFSQHATTMATIIAGGGNASEKTEGIAKQVLIGSSDFSNLLPDADDVFTAGDIHLENHSYGVGIENYYGNEAAAYDQQIYNNPTLIHVFSSGNLGSSNPDQGTYATLNRANLSGNFKQAKNILTVTSADTSFTVNSKNSRGPAYDGRVKPDLTAFGQEGTSDAAAMLSGICALLQQQFYEQYNRYPDFAEIKSILIASADDIEQEGIDYTSGYGNVNAYRAISLLNKQQLITKPISKGETITIPLTIPPGIKEFRLVVSWIDAPAVQNSEKALVDDMDVVIEGNQQTVYPWVLSSKPLMDSLNSLAVRKSDHINPAEYFTIGEPVAGDYSVIIDASHISSPMQNISIAYWYEANKTFEWNYPTSNDKLEANRKTDLMWDSQGAQIGTLYLQQNDGDWEMLMENFILGDHFRWTPPDTLCEARLKMQIGGEAFITDAFLISPRPRLSVAFDCDTNFALTWNAIPGASEYDVYTMGSQYLQVVATVQDTSLVLPKGSDYYFAVAPKLNLSAGIKNQTIKYTDQGALCYINLFDAQRYDSGRVTLQLNLSSILNVDKVVFYKVHADGNDELLSTIQAPGLPRITAFDNDLNSTMLRYRASVILSSGLRFDSEIRTVYIEQKGKVILFPNPVVNNELKILSEGEGLSLAIVNMLGKVMLTADLINNLDTLDVSTLPPGLYVLRLVRNNKQIDSEKFLKE